MARDPYQPSRAGAQAPPWLSRPLGDRRRPQGDRRSPRACRKKLSRLIRSPRLRPSGRSSVGRDALRKGALTPCLRMAGPGPAGRPLGRLTRRAEFPARRARTARIGPDLHAAVAPTQAKREKKPSIGRARRLDSDPKRRRRGRAQSGPQAVERGAAARPQGPLEAEGDHDYVLMARREALGRRFAALVDDVRTAFRARPALRRCSSRARAGPTGRRRTETREHEVRGHAEPFSRDRAVGPGDGGVAIFLRRSFVSQRASTRRNCRPIRPIPRPRPKRFPAERLPDRLAARHAPTPPLLPPQALPSRQRRRRSAQPWRPTRA